MRESAWQGHLALTYQRRGDRTVPQAQVQSPLKVQRPFYPEGPDVCQSVLLHTAGGMVGGDRLTYDLHLQPQTHALVTTAAAAKVYSNHPQPAQVQGRLRVEAGACLEWLPQETIVFEGGQYHASWQVELAAGADWLGWDVLRLGRTARGERFCRGEVRSHWQVWYAGELIWIDPQRLLGSEALWNSPQALHQCPVLATLVWIGSEPDPALVTAARQAWASLPDTTGDAGITYLRRGLLCRYRGSSTSEARRWFTAVWRCWRPHYARRSLSLPRVWQREGEVGE